MKTAVVVLSLALTLVATASRGAALQWDLSTARLTLDEKGYVARLVFADGRVWPVAGRPAFWLETKAGRRLPESVTSDTERLHVVFAGGTTADFFVACQSGFVLFRLAALDTKEAVERLNLFNLSASPSATIEGTLNAAFAEGNVAAVMAAEPNVQAISDRFGGSRGDRQGCTHEFARLTDGAQVGRSAARFTATADTRPGGWSMSGEPLHEPRDLRGCHAIRAWIHGDGQGELLKIQLHDDQGGVRDDYVKIDFQGWRQVVLGKPQLNTLHGDRVVALNFYYNGLPAGRTVECMIDQVEALLERQRGEQVVLLEDFESPDSPLWSAASPTLSARTVKEHGLRPAAFAVLACPEKELMPTIECFEQAAGLPSPRPGGVWNKQSPWVKRSYFFLTRFGEEQFDEALSIARRGGFDMILLGQESWCAATGHYEINRQHFPDGLEGLRRTLRRFKQAGFHVGLHFLGPSIYPPDRYLTPVPDPRLVKDVFTALAADVDAKAGFLPTPSAPADFPAADGGYDGAGSVLQVGDELVWYGSRSTQAPYGFTECRRGYQGTTASPHKQGERVAHVLKSYGYFLFDMDTSLLDEATANLARVANACDVDMLYFDGSERLQGDHWYYNARLHKAFYDKLQNKNMLLQASSFSHYSWHILARSASADGHGDLKGYLDERSPWFPTLARMGMPLDIGWYYGYDGNASLDMYEYILGATIGYDSSMSYQVSTQGAARHPFTAPILDLIARYEKLRLSGRVPEAMRARLRIDPVLGSKKTLEERAKLFERRRDYRLLDVGRRDVFQRVVYDPWQEMTALDGHDNSWPVEIKAANARIGVQIHARGGPWLVAGPSYDAANAVPLEDFRDLAPYLRNAKGRRDVRVVERGQGGSVLPGVTQRLESNDDSPRPGMVSALYTAENSLGAGGWSAIGRSLAPPLDLARHKAIGFWLRGDGHGGQFKLQLRDGKGAMDYHVTNDYSGWRYQQLVRPEHDAIDYRHVSSLTFYYNGLPGRTTVRCGLAGVKALLAVDRQEIVDPYVELGGHRWAWKGALDEGQYLFFWPGESVTRFGWPLAQPEPGGAAENVILAAGSYTARFGCQGRPSMAIRARITVQPDERWEVPAQGPVIPSASAPR